MRRQTDLLHYPTPRSALKEKKLDHITAAALLEKVPHSSIEPHLCILGLLVFHCLVPACWKIKIIHLIHILFKGNLNNKSHVRKLKVKQCDSCSHDTQIIIELLERCDREGIRESEHDFLLYSVIPKTCIPNLYN